MKYGLRRIVESAFSWLKRAFGEYVTAKRLENMVRGVSYKGPYIQHLHKDDENSLRVSK